MSHMPGGDGQRRSALILRGIGRSVQACSRLIQSPNLGASGSLWYSDPMNLNEIAKAKSVYANHCGGQFALILFNHWISRGFPRVSTRTLTWCPFLNRARAPPTPRSTLSGCAPTARILIAPHSRRSISTKRRTLLSARIATTIRNLPILLATAPWQTGWVNRTFQLLLSRNLWKRFGESNDSVISRRAWNSRLDAETEGASL